jgi:hypothetical protein
MSKVTYEDMKDFLQNSVSNVTFTKKDGSTRIMKCTLMPEHLPAVEVKEDTEEKTEKAVNTSVLAVWDLQAEGWRSFRIDSITNFDVVPS